MMYIRSTIETVIVTRAAEGPDAIDLPLNF